LQEKGKHEDLTNYRGTKKHHFDDVEEAKEAIKLKN